MHRLLLRQLRRHFREAKAMPGGLTEFLKAIDEAYGEFDSDRAMLERSLELSSQELLQANAEMRAVFRAFPDLFLWIDGDDRVLDAQLGDDRDLYLSCDTLVGQGFLAIHPPEVSAPLKSALQQVRRTRSLAEVEFVLDPTGSPSYYEARFLPLVDEKILVIIRNITERKHAETALAREKERLAVTLRSITEGVITTDTKGRVMLLNRVAEEFTGWTQEDAHGLHIGVVLPLQHDRTGHSLDDSIARLQHHEEGSLGERSCVLAARDGRQRLIAEKVSSIRDAEGCSIGSVVVFRDVTEERRREQERLRASKLESVGLLAGGIAHDFNNLLTVFLGYISIAEELSEPSSPIREWLGEAERAGMQARDLTQQLLTFAKGGAPIRATASIGELLRESARFALRGSNVRCKDAIAADLMPVEIDKGQMNQVLNNLIINADQAMPDGGSISLRADNVDLGHGHPVPLPPGRYVRIQIADQGVGIPVAVRDKIFDPYFTTKEQGNGLGLATSYAIVRKHDGAILVDSEEGVGTTFSIFLPVSERALPVASSKRQGRRHFSGRVLVVDDDVDLRRVAAAMLEVLGLAVATARDGAEGVELYRQGLRRGERFDVVLADLTIPGGMGGLEMTQQLLEIDPTVRVIATSGYSNDPVLASHGDHGFAGILAKPYTLEVIETVLGEVLPASCASESEVATAVF